MGGIIYPMVFGNEGGGEEEREGEGGKAKNLGKGVMVYPMTTRKEWGGWRGKKRDTVSHYPFPSQCERGGEDKRDIILSHGLWDGWILFYLKIPLPLATPIYASSI